MKTSCDICVIGNGAIGKASALALTQAGLKVVLVAPAQPLASAQADKPAGKPADQPAPDDLWDHRVYALNPVARALLDSLKVWDAMDTARIAPVDAMAVQGDAPDQSGRLNFDAYGARVGALAWIVEDSNLNRALDAALRFASGLTMVSGAARALNRSPDVAEITLDNGDTITARLVIGADGAHSWVRTQADIGMDYRSYHQRAVVASFATEHPHQGVARQWFLGTEGIVALLPLAGNRVSLVWSAPESLAERLMNEPAEQLAQRLMDLPGQVLGQLSPLPPAMPKAFPLRLIRSRSLIADRVALVGDAAHVVHPLAGQGMNLGFADIQALLDAIAKTDPSADCGDARTLGRYARARKEDVLLMQITTDGLQRLFASDLAPVKVLRNAGMSLVNKLPFLKRRLMTHALGPSLSIPTDSSR
jgi:ubiquinone biosynthesis UbiH/UbiF/VisC/COQ6 family hydroxylase